MVEIMIAKESSDSSHYEGSFRFWILVVVCAYLGFALYWAISGLIYSFGAISDSYTYQMLSQDPWWWMVLYYASEGVSGTIGLVIRAAAGFFALYSAFQFWRKKEIALSRIGGKVGNALLLEGVYYLLLIPFTMAAFVYFLVNGNLYYFDHTPGTILLFVTGIPTLVMVIVIPSLLFKLRSEIASGSSSQDIIKWSCLTSVIYLLVVFWFNYSMAWVGNMVPYSRIPEGQYGLSFLLEPINFLSFVVTVFGLFLIAILGLRFTLSAIRKETVHLNMRRIGFLMMSFGGYFIFSLLYYYLTGGYAAHPNVWYEMIGPLHNPNLLWCVTFLFLGLALITRQRKSED